MSFAYGPDATSDDRKICLSASIDGEPGQCVHFDLRTLPTSGASDPTAQLDLVLPRPVAVQVDDRDFVIALNAVRGGFLYDSSNSFLLSGISLTSASGIVQATIQGKTQTGRGPQGTYTVELSLAPETDVRRRANAIVEVSATANETLTLDPADPARSEEQAIRNSLRPVAVTAVKTALDARLTIAGQNAAVTALETLTGRTAQPVPATADVCARRVVPGEGSIAILPSVGGFDLVAAIIPPQGQSRCAATRLVLAGLATVDLAMIRTWRDRELQGTRFGRRTISRYYRHAVEIDTLLASNPAALSLAANALEHAGRALGGNPASALRVIRKGTRLAAWLRPLASPELSNELRVTRVWTRAIVLSPRLLCARAARPHYWLEV